MTDRDGPTTTTTKAHDLDGPAHAAIRLGVVVGTTRPGRKAAAVAQWVQRAASAHPQVRSGRVELRLLDLAEVALPLLDEPVAAAFGRYQQGHTRAWAAAVAGCDGFLFVTPEYNHSIPAALKNAIDYLFAEWHHKPAGIISYGLVGGVRAAEHLRTVLLEVKTVPVSEVALSVFEDFTYADVTDPASSFEVTVRDHQGPAVLEMISDVLSYTSALATLRTPDPVGARKQRDNCGLRTRRRHQGPVVVAVPWFCDTSAGGTAQRLALRPGGSWVQGLMVAVMPPSTRSTAPVT